MKRANYSMNLPPLDSSFGVLHVQASSFAPFLWNLEGGKGLGLRCALSTRGAGGGSKRPQEARRLVGEERCELDFRGPEPEMTYQHSWLLLWACPGVYEHVGKNASRARVANVCCAPVGAQRV